MSRFIKHVGQIMSTQEKCIVIFREIPKEPENCLVVQTADLTEEDHNDLINEVESITAQQLNDLANHLHTRFFRDGSNLGSLAFDEIELNKLINNGEMKILSEGTYENS